VTTDAVSALLDREAIRTVLYRYCRAVDRADIELLESVYHPDAWEHHGNVIGDAAEFRRHAVTRVVAPDAYRVIRHSLGSINIELDGDVAHVESYFDAACLPEGHDGPHEVVRLHYGRYVDRFERRDGDWRIARRVVVQDFIEMRPAREVDDDGYPRSSRSTDDVVYRRSPER
jgi:hypothetical protein